MHPPGLRREPSQPQPLRARLSAVDWWIYVAGVLVVVVLGVVVWLVLRGPGNAADAAWLDDKADGEIVYCSGRDVSRSQQRSVDDFNNGAQSGQAKARLVDDLDSSQTADGERLAYLRALEDGECDVVYLDVIYTAEFASKTLLRDMTSYLQDSGADETFDPRMMKTVTWEGRRWGAPKQLDAGMIFYRTDGDEEPVSWQQILARATPAPGEKPGLRLQLDAYEGLMVVFLELAYAAGAQPIVSEDGNTADVDQPETRAALAFMREAIQRRAVPKQVTSQGDAGSFYAFSTGRARFLRSWPYVESRFLPEAQRADDEASSTAPARYETARNHGVAALPPWKPGMARVGILGGHNLAIPRSAKNPEGALHLIDFLTSRTQIRRDATTASLAPVLPELWNDPAVQADPALSAVNDLDLQLRPMLTNYAEVSSAIYNTLRRVLRTRQSEEQLGETLRKLDGDVQALLDGE